MGILASKADAMIRVPERLTQHHSPVETVLAALNFAYGAATSMEGAGSLI